MRHDWIIDVLSDLRTYALRNDLPILATGVEALLDKVADEIDGPKPHATGDDRRGDRTG